MLRLGIDANLSSPTLAFALGQVDHLVERGNLELAVVGMRAVRQPLARPHRLDLRQREVLSEPAHNRPAVDDPGLLPIREAIRDVGRAAHLVLVTRDQDAVFRRDEIGLDEVGAHLDRKAVGFQRVLRPVPARAAVRDDERPC